MLTHSATRADSVGSGMREHFVFENEDENEDDC